MVVVHDFTGMSSDLRAQADDGTALAKIAAAVGDGVVTSVKILGPQAPSWKKGRYHIAGRGPRDTYG